MDAPIPMLHSAVGIMTPLLLAATGGLFTELAGSLNIALEGLLLVSAFVSFIGAHFSGSLVVGVLSGILSSMLLASLLGFFTFRLKSNIFITGLAVNLFAGGLTVVLSHRIFATRGVLVLSNAGFFPSFNIEGFPKIPVLWDLFMGHTWYVYFSWLLVFVSYFFLFKTPFGFRLRASAKHGSALASLGIKSDTYKFSALIISGFTCGVAGSLLTLNLGAFVPNISSGKGWIALVVIFLGNKHPFGLFAAALIFGLAEAFSNYAQGAFNLPSYFILALPYIFTLIVMIISSMANKKDK